MKPIILTLMGVFLGTTLSAQVNTFPYTQSFEDPFTTGYNVNFLPDWWGNYVVADSMGQYDAYAKSGAYSLYMVPEGEDFRTIAQVALDLTSYANNYAEFWVATRKNGLAEDQKRVKLSLAVSYDGGLTFPYATSMGPHEGFPNENTDFSRYFFPLPPEANDQADVVLRFVGKSGGGPHLPAILLLDDVTIGQSDVDSFPPYVLGGELPLSSTETVTIPFSEPLLIDSAEVLEHYAFRWPEDESGTPIVGEGPLPGVTSAVLSVDGYSVTLTLDPSLSIGETYALEMYNITDLQGNTADTLTIDELVYNIPSIGALVFSEVFFGDPTDADPLEKLQFVEIYNPTGSPVPLGGLRIKGAISAHNLPNIKLQPGEYYVVTRNAVEYYATFGIVADEWKGSWIEYDTAGEEELEPQSLVIQSTDHHGPLIDSIGFDFNNADWLNVYKIGYSMEVCNKLSDRLDPANWSLAADTQAPYTFRYNGFDYPIYATPATGCLSSTPPTVELGPDGNYCGVTELTLDAGNPGATYLWSTGEETQTIVVTNSATYSVVVNNGASAAYDTITVSLVPAIEAAMETVPAAVCPNEAINFADNSVTAVKWLWDFGDGAFSMQANPSHAYESPGEYTVILTAYNAFGCQDTVKADILVYDNTVDWTLPSLVCEATEAQFTDNSTNAAQWLWDFGDGNTSTDQNPVHTYAADGQYIVSLTITTDMGCSNTATQEITVHPNSIDWTLPAQICQHNAAAFADNSLNATQWLWDFGDGNTSTDQSPEHTYANAGTYTVSLTVTNSFGCNRTETQEVTVDPNEAEWTLPANVCQSTAANFAASSNNAASWAWDFGDGNASTDQNPAHTFAHAGTYTVMLTVTNANGCEYVLSEDVTVNPNAVDWTLPTNFCQNTALNFAENSANATAWNWDFGDGNTSADQNPAHTYAEAGTYTLSLTVTNSFGCSVTETQEITVNPNAVSWSLPNQVCQNTAANFGDNSKDAAAWHWDFGDGNTSADQNPAHTYAEAGTYTVTLTVTNTFGCDYTVSEDIGVEANALIWTLPENVCTYNEVSFTEQGGTAQGWHWDFGDGNSANSQNPKHSYSEPGEYTVSLTVNNAKGCEYTYSEKISVSICTGVEGTLNQSLSVYPNPSKGVLSVQLEAAYGEQAAVQLVNKMGQLVLYDSWTHQQGQVHSMDVSTLPSGLYLLRIYTESGTATRKVIIER